MMMMRLRLSASTLLLPLLLLLLASPLYAQYTTISGQILDPSGNPYANASYSISFVVPTQPGGAPLPSFSGTSQIISPTVYSGQVTDSFGNLNSIQLPDNGQITPSGTQWKFSVCAKAGTPCFTVAITITGAAQNLTIPIQAAAAPLNAFSGGTVFGNIIEIGTTMGLVSGVCVPSGNDVLDATCFPGADPSIQIAACRAALPANGGICDCRGFYGAQSGSTNFLSGLAKPVTFLFGQIQYTTVPLVFPSNPASGTTGAYSIRIIGAGPGSTIFIPSTSNAVVFQGPQATRALDMASIENLSVQAHASGSTGPAIDVTGFRTSLFKDISYLTNANGTGNFAWLYHVSAYPINTYGNVFQHTIVEGQTGPSVVWQFNNAAVGGVNQGAVYNSNRTTIRDPWIYLNTGITTIVDATESTMTVVEGGEFEHNSQANPFGSPYTTMLLPGKQTTWRNNWMETDAGSNVTTIQGVNDGAGSASTDSHFENNYIGDANKQTFAWQSGATNMEIKGMSETADLVVTTADGNANNLLQRSGVFTSPQPDTLLQVQNSTTGGGCWALDSIGAGGLLSPAGLLGVYDCTNNKFAIEITPSSERTTFVGTYVSSVNVVTSSSGTATFDFSLGNTEQIALTENTTGQVANLVKGETITFIIVQNGSAAKTFTWPAAVYGGMTISSSLGSCNAQSFVVTNGEANLVATSPGVTGMTCGAP
jgi:hypothetical protein